IETDDIDAERFESCHCARDVGAEEHAAADVECDLCLERNSSAELFEELLDSGDRGFDFEDVLRRLDEEEVDASFYKVLSLVVEILRELVEGDVAECGVGARWEHAGRAHRCGDEFWTIGCGIFIGGYASDSCGGHVDVADFVA